VGLLRGVSRFPGATPANAARMAALPSINEIGHHRRILLAQVSYHEAVGLDFAGIRFERHYKVGFIS
jgi:hypothetical protein